MEISYQIHTKARLAKVQMANGQDGLLIGQGRIKQNSSSDSSQKEAQPDGQINNYAL
jgi:hypothetical protein